MAGELDADAFGDIFGGHSITLMDGHSLRRELALLRAALPPSSPEDVPRRPLLSMGEVLTLTHAVAQLLPPQLPDNASWLGHVLQPLPRSQSRRLRELVRDAYSQLRHCQPMPPLWLVPALWNHRIQYLLEGQMFPASIRCWQRRYALSRPP